MPIRLILITAALFALSACGAPQNDVRLAKDAERYLAGKDIHARCTSTQKANLPDGTEIATVVCESFDWHTYSLVYINSVRTTDF